MLGKILVGLMIINGFVVFLSDNYVDYLGLVVVERNSLTKPCRKRPSCRCTRMQ